MNIQIRTSSALSFLAVLAASTLLVPVPASAAMPYVSITGATTNTIHPAATIVVAYDGVPKSTLQILAESGKVIGSSALEAGGGSAVVTFSKVPPSGFYSAQIVDSNHNVYVKSNPLAFFLVTPKHSLTATLDVNQTMSDGGVDIMLQSITTTTRKPTVTVVVHSHGYPAASYSAAAGKKIGGFSDSSVSVGGISIKIRSADAQAGTATLVITTEGKG